MSNKYPMYFQPLVLLPRYWRLVPNQSTTSGMGCHPQGQIRWHTPWHTWWHTQWQNPSPPQTSGQSGRRGGAVGQVWPPEWPGEGDQRRTQGWLEPRWSNAWWHRTDLGGWWELLSFVFNNDKALYSNTRLQYGSCCHYIAFIKSWNIILVSHHIPRTEICRILPSVRRELCNLIEGYASQLLLSP